MKRRLAVALAAMLVVLTAAACSPEDGGYHPGDGGDILGDRGDTAGCTSAAPYCSSDGRYVLRCDPATGAVETLETCYPDRACRSGTCATAVCPPGQSECVDSTTQRRCAADGSGWETTTCEAGLLCTAAADQCEPPCLLRMFVLLDRSGSMSEGTPPKWDQAREALRALMAGPAAADIQFGFGTFNTDGNCAIDGLVSYPVPEANAAIIDSFFTGNVPDGNTPLAFALDYMANVDTEANLLDPAYHNALLVVTDGMDTCFDDCDTRCAGSPTPFRCLMDCATESEAIVAESLAASTSALRDSRQIRTYVIGFGAGVSDLQLSAIADNGGTGQPWTSASNVEELEAALEAVIGDLELCNPIIFG